MSKQPFFKLCSVKAFSKAELAGYLIAYLAVFCLVPLLLFIPREVLGFPLDRWLSFVVFPATLLIIGIVMGVKHGLCLMYPLFVGITNLLFGAIFGFFTPAWQYALLYGLFALASNAATEMFYTTRPKRAGEFDEWE